MEKVEKYIYYDDEKVKADEEDMQLYFDILPEDHDLFINEYEWMTIT